MSGERVIDRSHLRSVHPIRAPTAHKPKARANGPGIVSTNAPALKEREKRRVLDLASPALSELIRGCSFPARWAGLSAFAPLAHHTGLVFCSLGRWGVGRWGVGALGRAFKRSFGACNLRAVRQIASHNRFSLDVARFVGMGGRY